MQIFTQLFYSHHFNRNWSKVSGFRNGVHLSEYLNPQSSQFDPHFLRVLRGAEDSVLEDGGDQLLFGINDRTYGSGGLALGGFLGLRQSSYIFHNISFGFRYHVDQVERRHQKDYFQMLDGELKDLQEREKGTHNKDFAYAKTFFIEDEWDFSNGLVASAILRLEDVSTERRQEGEVISHSYQALSPGLGVQYSPFEGNNLIGGASRGGSVVSPGQLKEVEPEESLNYEAGVKYQGLFEGGWIGFYSDYKNIKGFCSFSSGCEDEEFRP